jgi:hypothetical protein
MAGLVNMLQRSVGNQTVNHLLRGLAIQRAEEEDETLARAVHDGAALQRQDDGGDGPDGGAADTGTDAGDMVVAPVDDIAGAGEDYEEVAYGKTIKVHGQTNARFSHSFKTSGVTTAAGSGCATCKPPTCIHVTGTLESTYSVAVTVTLPKASDFPGLTPCQKQRVQDFIDTTLTDHEQKHVSAFNTYNGSTQQPFDLTLCRGAFAAKIQAMHDAEERTRHKAAQDASDALDAGGANQFNVDLDCDDGATSQAPNTASPDETGAQDSDSVLV